MPVTDPLFVAAEVAYRFESFSGANRIGRPTPLPPLDARPAPAGSPPSRSAHAARLT